MSENLPKASAARQCVESGREWEREREMAQRGPPKNQSGEERMKIEKILEKERLGNSDSCKKEILKAMFQDLEFEVECKIPLPKYWNSGPDFTKEFREDLESKDYQMNCIDWRHDGIYPLQCSKYKIKW